MAMTRKKKLQLYLKELERDRHRLQLQLDWFKNPAEQNDVAYFSLKYLQKRMSDVERVIHTIRLIIE